jgi:pimeloyl-ACP methyl ester carboxylesterase
MSLIVFLPGNPGSASDFEPVRRALGDDVEVVHPTLPPDGGRALADLLAPIRAAIGGRDDAILVGYSWGAWLALRYATEAERAPRALVLVNPHLVVDSPLGGAAALLVRIPGLADALLARKAPQMADEFLRRSFAPASPPDDPALVTRLDSGAVWRAAARRKLLHQRAGLEPLDAAPCPIAVVRGEADQVARWDLQTRALAGAAAEVEAHGVPDAGHALLWTHPERVADIVRGSMS